MRFTSDHSETNVVSGTYTWTACNTDWKSIQEFREEGLACSHLEGGNVVPFIGVYSIRKRPLALVLKFMDHLNLGEYLSNNKIVGKRELVPLHRRVHCSPHWRLEASCWK